MVCPVDQTIETIKKCGHVPESIIEELCFKAEEILIEEANVQIIHPPVTVCGDIHGQFYDLLKLFRIGGDCPDTKYLFLGDFVDRGYHSLETFLLLMCLKIRYPDRITLIRGNHESRQITSAYGFYDECVRKYGSPHVWRLCCQVFDYLALGALVGGPGGVFCVHGGLSPSIKNISEISYLDRKQEVPHDGPMCDLLWSDPDDDTMVDGLRLDASTDDNNNNPDTNSNSNNNYNGNDDENYNEAGNMSFRHIQSQFHSNNRSSGSSGSSDSEDEVEDDEFSSSSSNTGGYETNGHSGHNNYINTGKRNYQNKSGLNGLRILAVNSNSDFSSLVPRTSQQQQQQQSITKTPSSLFSDNASALELYDKLSTDSWSVSPRGAGYLFGALPTKAFNHINNTSVIARAHQLVMEGYKEIFDKQLVTVWSAPNYCYRCGNVAALLSIGDDLSREYAVFDAEESAVPAPTQIAKPEYFL